MCAEIATYRVQMCESFTLDQAAAIADYLSQLGISHLYSSPVLQAAKAARTAMTCWITRGSTTSWVEKGLSNGCPRRLLNMAWR